MLQTPTMPTQSLKGWKQARPVPALALLIALLLLLLVSLAWDVQPAQAARAEADNAAPVHQSRALLLPRLLDQRLAPAVGHVATVAAQHNPPPGHFPFKTVQSADGLLVIHYYNRAENLAQGYIAQAQQALQHPVRDTLGFSLIHRVDIYIYSSRQDFLAGAPVTNPAETAALADPVHNTIYLTSADQGDEGAVNDLPHELTHIVFHQNEDSGHLEPYISFYPRWLDEGLAAYDEPPNSRYTRSYDDALAKAVAARHPVDILQQFVHDYPTDRDTDYLAYAESRSFIAYLIATYGSDTFHGF
ncbi:MAG TPA: peptidase MA family metallohydrolase, partial [Ktedonobacterales bacterium]